LDVDVAVACRVLGVSRSGYYEWRERPPSARDLADAHLANTILDIHRMSRRAYGAPRVHAELRLGQGVRVGRKRVARLMRLTGVVGLCHRSKRRGRPADAVHDDLVQRQFIAEQPDRLWCTDITEHPTSTGKVYCCAVLDVYSRAIVGWSIADHMRTELVVDALQMATWRRRPPPGVIVHSDRGSQGGFNRSSQHLDHGGVWWRVRGSGGRSVRRVRGGSGQRIGRCGRRCARRVVRSRRGLCSVSSGG
jgi:hypothetical protein